MNRVLLGISLLICMGILAQDSAPTSSAPTTAPSNVPEPSTMPSAAPATQPAMLPADRMLDAMLRGNGPIAKPLQPIENPPIYDQTSGRSVAPAPTTQIALVREGDYVRDRTGRLQKGSDGLNYEFVFDADGRAMQDPPVIILPNLKLMAMENAVNAANRDLRFRITGPVTEYKGRNYVLLEKVVVIPDVTGKL